MEELKLRDYQQELIERAREMVKRGNRRILLQASTGTGKTAIAIGVMRSAWQKGYSAIFFAHRRELVDQTVARFRRYGIHPKVLMAGREREDGDDSIWVASYQTFERRADYFGGEFDVIFFDEAHIGVERQKRVLDDLLYRRPNAVVFGITATPMTNSGPGLGSVYQVLLQSKRLEWFIEHGYLVEPQFMLMQMIDPDEKFRVKGQEYDEDDVFAWLRQPHVIGNIIQNYMDNFLGERFILFANSVGASWWIAEQFGKHGIPVAHIDYNTPDKERKRIIEAFKRGDIVGLTNVDIFSEGFDVPDVSVVIHAAPTRSLVRYIQRSGRALRPADGKEKAYIVDHAGVIRRFGTLYNYQEWVLEPERPERRNPLQAVKLKTPPKERVCPICNAVFVPKGNTCPNCGHDFRKDPNAKPLLIIPGVMLEYREYLRKMRRGELTDCVAVKRWPEHMMLQRFMDELIGWVEEQRQKGKDTSFAFADIIYYSARCRCPHEEGVSRRFAQAKPPTEFTRRMIKRYFALKSDGFYKFEGGFPCWKKRK